MVELVDRIQRLVPSGCGGDDGIWVGVPGRDDTFYSCTACHGFKLIAQQGMNRRQWEDSINLMVAKHNMPPLDAKTRETVLNYLEGTFPPRTQRGWQNPFLNR